MLFSSRLLRGFSPSPPRSVPYLTACRVVCVVSSYVGEAPWSPRAWHSTVTYNKTLYLMGGTPLNSEIWMITDIRKTTSRPVPLTRAM